MADFSAAERRKEPGSLYSVVENPAIPNRGQCRPPFPDSCPGSGEWITPGDLPRWEVPDGTSVVPVGDNLKDAVHAYEKTHIETVLQKTDGDKKLAAELLGLSLSSLYRKLDELSQAEEEHDT